VLIEYKLGSFKAKLRAKIASVTSVIMSPVIDYEAMISPLFRWPNLVCHYMEISFKPSCVPVVLIDGEQLADFMIDKRIGVQRS
jgi:hypothetical protein